MLTADRLGNKKYDDKKLFIIKKVTHNPTNLKITSQHLVNFPLVLFCIYLMY